MLTRIVGAVYDRPQAATSWAVIDRHRRPYTMINELTTSTLLGDPDLRVSNRVARSRALGIDSDIPADAWARRIVVGLSYRAVFSEALVMERQFKK